jgi:glucokinase-like ROK family protein
MNLPRHGDIHLSRSVNRSAVLEQIRLNETITRTQIARRLNLSLPTVMRVVEDLVADGLVETYGLSSSTGGRPPSLLRLNSRENKVIGIDLGGTKMYGAVANIAGEIQNEQYSLHSADNSMNYMDELCRLIENLLETPSSPAQRIIGIGVGVPGITLSPQGKVIFAPSLNWQDVPLQQILQECFRLPVFVENDVKLAALGEHGFGVGKGLRNLVAISIGTGIGAGLILDGMLYRGYHQAAGEVGYIIPGIDALGKCYDQFGALESIASGLGVVARARRCLQEKGIPFLEQELTSESVFQSARQGEAWAKTVIDETVDYLSLAIGNISTILDPEIIILGGGVARSADLLIEPILRRLEGVLLYPPPLVASNLGFRAAVMGAILLVLNTTTRHTTVKHGA